MRGILKQAEQFPYRVDDGGVSPKTQRHRIMAFHGDKRVGWLDWTPGGEVENIDVHPDYQRHGVATEMWNKAKQIDGEIRHSSAQTAAGKAWAEKVGTGPGSDLLEFKDNWHKTGDPSVHAYMGDQKVGDISWFPLSLAERDGITPNSINMMWVHPDYRRQGIGTQLFNYTKQNVQPGLVHSRELSDAGREWSKSMGWKPRKFDHVDIKDLPSDEDMEHDT